MFIFRKINIGGVHLIEGFPNATRQRPEHSRVTTAARRQTAPPHNTQLLLALPTPTVPRRGKPLILPAGGGQEQRVVLNFVDADTTQKATGATSAQIDFVCVICSSNSPTAAVASLSLPLCVVVVVVVVVFSLKTVLTSIQYPSLSYSSRQRNEFPWSQANPK